MINNVNLASKQISWDYSISFTRMLAMIFIIICHFMQFYEVELAWWFNVGVQMFLFISGYLYSNKKIDDDIEFVRKNFVKILVPYYLFVVPVCIVGIILKKCSIIDFAKILLINGAGAFEGLKNLWFISYILVCYLLTPFISKLVKKSNCKNIVIRCILILLEIFIFFKVFTTYNAIWIVCYFVGLLIGKVEVVNDRIAIIIKYTIFVCGLISNVLQIACDYIFCYSFTGIIGTLYNMFCNMAHVMLGVILVYFLRSIYNQLLHNKMELNRILDVSDKYSYYVYIVHQLFILGSFSICSLIRNNFLAIVVTLSLVIILAICLKGLTDYVLNRICGKFPKYYIK